MHWKMTSIRLAAILTLVLASSVVFAQTGDGFDLSWNVVGGAGAGSPLTGSGFSVYSTLGQMATGPSMAGPYELCSGFWCGVEAPRHWIYLPLVLRNA
jgi:hypothetical protein